MGTLQQLPTVLVVDDHEVTVELLARLIRAEGYTVHTAMGCRDGLRVALQYGCDLLVIDLCLPDGDGCDLLRAVRAHLPVPAVAVTGSQDPALAAKAARAGFERVLSKPLVYADLSTAIRRLWDGPPAASR